MNFKLTPMYSQSTLLFNVNININEIYILKRYFGMKLHSLHLENQEILIFYHRIYHSTPTNIVIFDYCQNLQGQKLFLIISIKNT